MPKTHRWVALFDGNEVTSLYSIGPIIPGSRHADYPCDDHAEVGDIQIMVLAETIDGALREVYEYIINGMI